MTVPILVTKHYIPHLRSSIIPRPRLITRLNDGLARGCQLTLISAPAGFGKTTLVSEWLAGCDQKVAWLSLDKGDNDLSRFLTYLISALQTIAANIGAGVLSVLQSPQPLKTEFLLTELLNEISIIQNDFILVLDDYHVIDSKPVDEAFTFLLDHLPPQMHLVITTREDPSFPLARLRARGQLIELRAADLRFSTEEAGAFLNQMMSLNLSLENIAALEDRTEGWIAGLQLAALSIQGREDITSFIQAFTGSQRFVLDYLVEEVLEQQSESIQIFLLCTSILDRMCGPLCDAVLASASTSGHETLDYLERANLFIVPLDNEQRWYRYHHLFRDLLRQRLHQGASSRNEEERVAKYHIRASQWYEENSFDLEAFQHAAAANDIERATRLMESRKIPLHDHYAVTTILKWLSSLPKAVMDANPLLWLRYGTMALVNVQTSDVERRLQAAETALATSLKGTEPDERARTMIGQIAAARATLILLSQYHPEEIIIQARRALEYLSPDDLESRFTAIWARGVAYQILGDRAAAVQAHTEALSICQKTGNQFHTTLVLNSLGQVQEVENLLYPAADSYKTVLQMFGNYPQPNIGEALLGLARIYYQWNELDIAEQYAQKSLEMAKQYDRKIDRYLLSEVFLARLKMTRGDVSGAAAILAQAEQSVRQNNFVKRAPDVATAQVLILLRQGDLPKAAHLAKIHELRFSQARVSLAKGDAPTALAVLEPLRQKMEDKRWADELLKVMVLQTIALQSLGEKDKAVQLLGDALALAEPGGFIRLFVDEGEVMRLLIEKQSRNRDHSLRDYVNKLLAAFAQTMAAPKSATPELQRTQCGSSVTHQKPDMTEPLSNRELEVLKLLRSELSGPEIAQQLVVSLNTLRTHTKNIYKKLGVNDRRTAIRRAEELELF